MTDVFVRLTPDYDGERLYRAVSEFFERTGAQKDILPGARVLLKPNLLSAHRPEACVTTRPELVSAVLRRLDELGVKDAAVADSPGGPYLKANLKSIYSACGYLRPELEPRLNYDLSYRGVHSALECGVPIFNIISPVLDADFVIDLAKLKTHSMTTVSASVKNLFGVTPGLQKADLHRRFPDVSAFCRMLCALAVTVKPYMAILDAVDSMEGNGPNGGTPKHTGLLLASRDLFALDSEAVRFTGIPAAKVPLLTEAEKLGLLGPQPRLSGDPLVPCDPPFVLPDTIRSTTFADSIPAPVRRLSTAVVDRATRSYPRVDRSVCVGCGKCAESCPKHIITLRKGKASMPRRGCISCFCCQELCPMHAISARRLLDK